MNIADPVRAALEEEYKRGKTHQEIADAHHISRSFIQSVMTGRRNYDGISLKHIERMFPHATLNLNGGGITQVASNVRVNNQSVNLGKSADAYRNEAVAAVIKLDLSGDDMKKVLNALMGIEV